MSEETIVKKYEKLLLLVKWLVQGRELVIDGIKYTVAENGSIIRMYDDHSGVEMPLIHIWKLLDNLSEDDLAIFGGEIVLTELKKNDFKKVK